MFVQYFPVLSLEIFNHLSYPFKLDILTVVTSKSKLNVFPQGIFIEGFSTIQNQYIQKNPWSMSYCKRKDKYFA